MNGIIFLRTTLMLTALVPLSGCTDDVDYRQVENINGLIYKVKGKEPFTGLITKQPSATFETLSDGTCQVPVVKGLLEGTIVCTDQAGRKLMETNMAAGKKNGIETYYLPETGKTWKSIEWKQGLIDGTASIYDAKSGTLRLQQTYKKNIVSGTEKAWDDNGNLITDLVVVENSPFSGFDKRLGRERHYENGALHGNQRDYSKNTNTNTYYVSSEKLYHHGVAEGRWTEYDQKGRQTKISVYKNGVLLSEDEKRWKGDRLQYRARTIQTNPNATAENYHRTLKKEEQISAISDQHRTEALNEILGREVDQTCVDQRVDSFLSKNGDEAIVSEKDLAAFEEKCSKKT